MQYCIPKVQSRSFEVPSDGVIRIVPKKSVRPPYPLDRTSLQLGAAPGGVKRLVVYAIVNERGETENIRLVRGAGEEVDRAAVAALRRWSFRPATGRNPRRGRGLIWNSHGVMRHL
jgi:TonB family protein